MEQVHNQIFCRTKIAEINFIFQAVHMAGLLIETVVCLFKLLIFLTTGQIERFQFFIISSWFMSATFCFKLSCPTFDCQESTCVKLGVKRTAFPIGHLGGLLHICILVLQVFQQDFYCMWTE